MTKEIGIQGINPASTNRKHQQTNSFLEPEEVKNVVHEDYCSECSSELKLQIMKLKCSHKLCFECAEKIPKRKTESYCGVCNEKAVFGNFRYNN